MRNDRTTGHNLAKEVVSIPIIAWNRKEVLRGPGHPIVSHKYWYVKTRTSPCRLEKDYRKKVMQVLSLPANLSGPPDLDGIGRKCLLVLGLIWATNQARRVDWVLGKDNSGLDAGAIAAIGTKSWSRQR